MGMSITVITANDRLANIDQHFKVMAGPGAGKTRFLINHIKNILTTSTRLKTSRKIACITYTTVAADNIVSRVGDHGGRLEISTIHSFLYKYLIKPYVHLVAAQFGLDATKIKGHDDVLFTGFNFISEWKRRTSQFYLDDRDIIRALEKIQWKYSASDELILSPPYPIRSQQYTIRQDSYMEYRKMIWELGLLHHDDVLFFSAQLCNQFPFVLDVLRAVFPYFLVDEFQDTSPIQIKLLTKLSLRETVVGVVGDAAQSIYGFLGAAPNQLHEFILPNMAEYRIDDNWRSSNQIVTLLNKVRHNLQQNGLRNIDRTPVMVLVGDKLRAQNWIKTTYPSDDTVILTRDNITANLLKKGINGISTQDLLKEIRSKDSASPRRRAISNSTKAIEHAKNGYFKDAMKTMEKLYNFGQTINDKKRALKSLKTLLDKRSAFEGGKLIRLYDVINSEGIAALTGLRSGAAKTFYDTTEYDQFAASVKNLYETGEQRTIHKAKGEEFGTVLLVIDSDGQTAFNETQALAFLLGPNLDGIEEHRVMYVALSRAKDNLLINVPSLSGSAQTALEAMGISVVSV